VIESVNVSVVVSVSVIISVSGCQCMCVCVCVCGLVHVLIAPDLKVSAGKHVRARERDFNCWYSNFYGLVFEMMIECNYV